MEPEVAYEWKSLRAACPPLRYFISYRSLEQRLAAEVEARLRSTGHEVWRDQSNLLSGDDWRREIVKAIECCDDVVVLLTPAASSSDQVLYEVDTAISLGKRLHCFTTRSTFASAHIQARLAATHVSFIDELLLAENLATQCRELIEIIATRLIAPETSGHPVDLNVFEYLSARKVFPPHNIALRADGSLSDTALRYRSHMAAILSKPAPYSQLILVNAALLESLAGEWGKAHALFKQALQVNTSPLADYHFACCLMERRRPLHAEAAKLDRSLSLLRAAFQRHPSPLIALALCHIASDSGRMRGPRLTELAAVAETKAYLEHDDDKARFRWLVPAMAIV